jgi:hypothetical protein
VIIIKQHRDEKKEGEGEPFFLAMEDSQSHIYISSGNLIIRQVKYLLPTKEKIQNLSTSCSVLLCVKFFSRRYDESESSTTMMSNLTHSHILYTV